MLAFAAVAIGDVQRVITGRAFRAARALRGWSVPDTADRLGIHLKKLYRIEAGEAPVDLHEGLRAVEVFGLPLEFFDDPERWIDSHSGVAQSAERSAVNRDVEGSSPSPGARKNGRGNRSTNDYSLLQEQAA